MTAVIWALDAEGVEGLAVCRNVWVVNPIAQLRRDCQGAQVVGIAGAGVVEDIFVSKNSPVTVIEQVNKSLVKVGASNRLRLRGAVALTVMDRKQRYVHLVADPIGAAIVYIYRSDNFAVACPNLRELVEIVLAYGYTLTRSFEYQLELLVAGNGGTAAPSPFVEVAALSPMAILEASSAGFQLVQGAQDRFYTPGEFSYEDLLEETVVEINANFEAVGASQSTGRVAHLTGGFDSRLVLAGLSSSGANTDYVYYCKGRPTLPDARIARAVAATAGVTMSTDPGVWTAVTPSDYVGSMIWPLTYSQGVLDIGPHYGTISRASGLVLSGGFGGTLRSTYSVRLRTNRAVNGSSAGRSLWSDYLLGEQGLALLSSDYINRFLTSIDNRFDVMRQSGSAEDQLGDRLYLSTRARYFMGHISVATSEMTPRFDPLYSPTGMLAALALPLESRSSNILGYDLLQRFAPKLLELGFDREKFGAYVFEHRDYDGNKTIPVSSDMSSETYPLGEPAKMETSFFRIPAPTEADLAIARRIGVSVEQYAGRRQTQLAIKRILKKLPSGMVDAYFDSNVLKELVDRPANTRVRIRVLYRLFTGLHWYVYGTVPPW